MGRSQPGRACRLTAPSSLSAAQGKTVQAIALASCYQVRGSLTGQAHQHWRLALGTHSHQPRAVGPGRCAAPTRPDQPLPSLRPCAARQDEWPLLVVVPASLRLAWAEELERWLPHLRPACIHVIEGKGDRVSRGALPLVTITRWGGCGAGGLQLR